MYEDARYLPCTYIIYYTISIVIIVITIITIIRYCCEIEVLMKRKRISAFTKSTRVNSQEYEVKLVDTAGQDEYSIFPTQYSMDIHGYVLVYSITSAKSFEVVQIIYDKLLDITGKVQYVKWKNYRHVSFLFFHNYLL